MMRALNSYLIAILIGLLVNFKLVRGAWCTADSTSYYTLETVNFKLDDTTSYYPRDIVYGKTSYDTYSFFASALNSGSTTFIRQDSSGTVKFSKAYTGTTGYNTNLVNQNETYIFSLFSSSNNTSLLQLNATDGTFVIAKSFATSGNFMSKDVDKNSLQFNTDNTAIYMLLQLTSDNYFA